jgi:hypothetical protein
VLVTTTFPQLASEEMEENDELPSAFEQAQRASTSAAAEVGA